VVLNLGIERKKTSISGLSVCFVRIEIDSLEKDIISTKSNKI
jgi:hypothetical protein